MTEQKHQDRPLRAELHEEDKPESLNPAEPRRTLGHPIPPPGPDKEKASEDPQAWPHHTFDAKGQAGAPGERPVAHGMPPVPPEPGGRDPDVEEALRTGIDPREDPKYRERQRAKGEVTPGDPPGRVDAKALQEAKDRERANKPPAPGPQGGEQKK